MSIVVYIWEGLRALPVSSIHEVGEGLEEGVRGCVEVLIAKDRRGGGAVEETVVAWEEHDVWMENRPVGREFACPGHHGRRASSPPRRRFRPVGVLPLSHPAPYALDAFYVIILQLLDRILDPVIPANRALSTPSDGTVDRRRDGPFGYAVVAGIRVGHRLLIRTLRTHAGCLPDASTI